MRAWVAFAAIGVLGAGVWAAQAPSTPPKDAPAPQADEPLRITVESTNVNLLFTVTDKKGRFVTDLVKDDFEVFENKKRQTIQQFAAESDLPLRLGILIDTSNSIRQRFRFEQEAASEFVATVLHPRVDKALVVSFDTQAQLASDLVDNPEDVSKAIDRLRPGGGTALYDAIYFACRDKLALDQPRHKFRRAIVVLGDGEDNISHYTRDQALEMAQRSDVVIYAISTSSGLPLGPDETSVTPATTGVRPRAQTDGDKVLEYLAEETGGRAFFPFKVQDLEQSFENIANELRHQYDILYRPEPLITDGLFHPIQLRVKGRKDLVVRVRSGYIASKM